MENGKGKKSWIGIAASALLFLAIDAGSLRAMNPDGPRRPRMDAGRRNALAAVESATGSFGDTDWSWVQESLVAGPDATGNAETMFVFVSLANVYLNRYELRRDYQGLSRAMSAFEWVVARHDLWGHRGVSGALIAYLNVGLARLEGECGIEGYVQRVEQLRARLILITEAEARVAASAGASSEGIASAETEADASTAALLAAASNLSPPSPETDRWDQTARMLAASVLSRCPTPASLLFLSEGALTYAFAGHEVPAGFQEIPALSPALRARVICGRSDPRVVSRDEIGDPLVSAVRAAEAIASSLTESFLWRFPPETACPEPDDSDGRDLHR